MLTIDLPLKRPEVLDFGTDGRLYAAFCCPDSFADCILFRDLAGVRDQTRVANATAMICHVSRLDRYKPEDRPRLMLRPTTCDPNELAYTPTRFGYWAYSPDNKYVCAGREVNGTVDLRPVVQNLAYRPQVFFGADPTVFVMSLRLRYCYRLHRMDENLKPTDDPPIEVVVGGRPLYIWPGRRTTYVLYSADHRQNYGLTVAFVDSHTGNIDKVLEFPHDLKACAVSPDELLLAAWGDDQLTLMDLDG